jgi:hypothetical protein
VKNEHKRKGTATRKAEVIYDWGATGLEDEDKTVPGVTAKFLLSGPELPSWLMNIKERGGLSSWC